MSRDSTGAYALPQTPFQPGTIADPAVMNSNLADLAAGLADSVSRSGQGAMHAALAMGGFPVTGMLDGQAATDAATVGQVAVIFNAEGAARAAAINAEAGIRAAADAAEARARDIVVQAAITTEATTRAQADGILYAAVLSRDGTQGPTADLSLGGFKLHTVGQLDVAAGRVDATTTASTVDGTTIYGAGPTGGMAAGNPGGLFHVSSTLPADTSAVVCIRRRDPTGSVSGSLINFYATDRVVGMIQVQYGNQTIYQTTSDYRVKHEVQPVAGAVALVEALRPVSFLMDGDVQNRRITGFLAHEAQGVVPEAVSGTKDAVDEDGAPVLQGIDHGRLVPVLWAAVRELADRLQFLESRQG